MTRYRVHSPNRRATATERKAFEVLSQKETVSRIHYEQTKAGALRPSQGQRSFRGWHVPTFPTRF